MVRQFFKFYAIAGLIALFFFCSFIIKVLPIGDLTKRKVILLLTTILSKLSLKVLGVSLVVSGKFVNGSTLYASNHMSYLDILILNSIKPFCFVTSLELQKAPVLGWIAQLSGCLFVNRKNKSNLSNEIKKITEVLQRGIDVLFFPEATSTNGEGLLRFRRPLFNSVIENDLDVVPVCLNFISIDSKPFCRQTRDYVCWYGDMEFLSHLWHLCHLRQIQVEVIALEPITNTKFKKPEEIAYQTYEMIEREFLPCLV